MPPILSRFQATLANIFGWFRSVFTNSNTVVVNVEDSVDPNHKTASGKIQRAIRFNSADRALKLHGAEVGQLTEENLTDVLDAHTNCTAVTHIVVTQHIQLSNIPTSIGKFVNLMLMDLSSNNLDDLPWSVMYLRGLKILNLSNNQFHSIPPIIGHLTSLEELILKGNYLQCLPTSLVHLKLLKVLQLDGNDKMIAPPVHICKQGTDAVIKHIQKRLGRSNMWSDCKQHYTEDSHCTHSAFQMKSLLEICVAAVLMFKINYFSQAYVPPALKRHLHDRSVAEMEAVKVSKCSRCKRYFSTSANFDGHDCTWNTLGQWMWSGTTFLIIAPPSSPYRVETWKHDNIINNIRD